MNVSFNFVPKLRIQLPDAGTVCVGRNTFSIVDNLGYIVVQIFQQ